MPEDDFDEIDEDDEEVDVEILEFALGDEEINELISKLNELKQTKKSFEFEIDDENELLIHHEDDEELNLPDFDEDEDTDEDSGDGEDEEIIFEVGGEEN